MRLCENMFWQFQNANVTPTTTLETSVERVLEIAPIPHRVSGQFITMILQKKQIPDADT
jgi:hypothetical protein